MFTFRIFPFYITWVEQKRPELEKEFGCLSAQVPQDCVYVQNFNVCYQPGLDTFFSPSKSKNAENILKNVLLFYFRFRNYALLGFVYRQIMREHHTIYDNNNTEVMWESHLSFCFHSACENLKITTIPIWINILVVYIHLNIMTEEFSYFLYAQKLDGKGRKRWSTATYQQYKLHLLNVLSVLKYLMFIDNLFARHIL